MYYKNCMLFILDMYASFFKVVKYFKYLRVNKDIRPPSPISNHCMKPLLTIQYVRLIFFLFTR